MHYAHGVSIASPRPLATAADLMDLDEQANAREIIDGQIVEKAAPSPEHGSAQVALSGMLFTPFGSSERGGGGPGGWWLMSEVEAAGTGAPVEGG